jgi:rare lipoprotein A
MRTVPVTSGPPVARHIFDAGATLPLRLCAAVALAVLLSGLASPVLADPPVGSTQVGQASWYGQEFGGRRTASGEEFDPEDLTGAHRTLPLGSRVRVTNLHNGRSVTVTINDRGPYLRRRAIDLSYGAARALGMLHRGIAQVRIELVES